MLYLHNEQHLDLLEHIMRNGTDKSDRTGTGTRASRLSRLTSIRFSGADHQKLHLEIELVVYCRRYEYSLLNENGVTIWDEWADDNGDEGLFTVTAAQLVASDGGTIDQLTAFVESLKTNPDSRRHIVSAWNVAEVKKMALPPCHALFQFYVAGGKLSCQLYQRSADVFLGVPFNIASYALLTMMLAQVCGYLPGEFIHTFGDAHIYHNHFEQVALQLSREPRPLPMMLINPDKKDLFSFEYEDFTLEGYGPYPGIKAPIAV